MGLRISLLNVRRSILIQASPTRVWQEFESFERIAAWLGHGHQLHVFEPRLGGQVDMSVEIDGEPDDLAVMVSWSPMLMTDATGEPYGIHHYYHSISLPGYQSVSMQGGIEYPNGQRTEFVSLEPELRFEEIGAVSPDPEDFEQVLARLREAG